MKIDYERLKAFGIDADKRKGNKQKMFCPECHNGRKNKADKSLSVDWEQCVAHCHYCGKSFFFGERERNREVMVHPTEQRTEERKGYRKPGRLCGEEPLDANMLKWFADRGIPAEVVQREGIIKVCRKLPQTGQVERCIVFPYHQNGELVNRKYRDGRKNFMLETGAKLVPWRIDHIRDTTECIITEGEMDALSFLAIGWNNVISVPNGAQNNLGFLDEFIETHLDNKLRVYIAVDSDTKGMQLRAELVRRLGEEQCRIVNYGKDCKDANELLVKEGPEALKQALAEAVEVPMEGVFTAADVKQELYLLLEKGLPKGAVFDLGQLDNLLSVETGRLMVVTGIPGEGKSEFIDEMTVRLSLRYDWRCAYFSPENFPVTLHMQKLVEKLVGKHFLKGVIKDNEFDAAVSYLSHNFLDILPEEGYLADCILERAEMLVRRKGIRVFVIDPYNCIEHQIPSGQSETQYISAFLERLLNFARRRQVLVILAAHPTKMKLDPLTKKFPVPTMYDISGSAAFFNKADFGIAIERDRDRGVTRVHVQKVKFRHLGYPGVASFHYNLQCGRYVAIQEAHTPDLPDIVPEYDNSNWLGKKQAKMVRMVFEE